MVDVKYRAGIWRRMIELFQAQKYWFNQIAEDFDLTPQAVKALHQIPIAGSLTMKELAGELWCDASNATGIVDRLESRGFVERRPSENDRRVKCVVLTPAGRRLRRRIDDRVAQSPPAIAALSETDQQHLAAILERALDNAHRQLEAREGGASPR